MKTVDPDAWRFVTAAQSGARLVMSGDYSEELVIQALSHLMCRAFRQGVEEGQALVVNNGEPIPVTDLTHIPELSEHVKEKRTDEAN